MASPCVLYSHINCYRLCSSLFFAISLSFYSFCFVREKLSHVTFYTCKESFAHWMVATKQRNITMNDYRHCVNLIQLYNGYDSMFHLTLNVDTFLGGDKSGNFLNWIFFLKNPFNQFTLKERNHKFSTR